MEAEFVRCLRRQVNNATAREWPAVGNCDNHAPAIAPVTRTLLPNGRERGHALLASGNCNHGWGEEIVDSFETASELVAALAGEFSIVRACLKIEIRMHNHKHGTRH
jgi:hypothetical protein